MAGAPLSGPALVAQYNALAANYHNRHFRSDFEIPFILSQCPFTPSSTILDVGRGPALLLAAARARTSGRLVGIDNATNMIAVGRQAVSHLQNIELIQADIIDLCAMSPPAFRAALGLQPGQTFDAVVMANILTNFQDREELNLRQFSSVITPGTGRLIFNCTGDDQIFGSFGFAWSAPTPGQNRVFAIHSLAPPAFLAEPRDYANDLVERYLPRFHVQAIVESTRLTPDIVNLQHANNPYGLGHLPVTRLSNIANIPPTWGEALQMLIQNACNTSLPSPSIPSGYDPGYRRFGRPLSQRTGHATERGAWSGREDRG